MPVKSSQADQLLVVCFINLLVLTEDFQLHHKTTRSGLKKGITEERTLHYHLGTKKWRELIIFQPNPILYLYHEPAIQLSSDQFIQYELIEMKNKKNINSWQGHSDQVEETKTHYKHQLILLLASKSEYPFICSSIAGSEKRRETKRVPILQ